MSDDKITGQGAAMELLRSEIFQELHRDLKLNNQPWELPVLKSKLNDLMVGEGFDNYAARVRKAMEQPDLKDYKIELYLRHFVMEPLLELNYHSIIQTLKRKLATVLIPQFPLGSVVLEPQAQELYGQLFAGKFQDRAANGTLEESPVFRLLHGLGMESLLLTQQQQEKSFKRTTTPSTFGENPLTRAQTSDLDRRSRINALEYILKPVSTILQNLSVLANFESPVQIIVNALKHLESVLRKVPEMAALEKQNLSKGSYAYRVMEYNCGVLLDLGMIFAKSTLKKYGIYEYKSPLQFQRLERELVKFIRDEICSVSKVDGMFTPAQCVKEFEQVTKKVWLKCKIDLAKRLQPLRERRHFLSAVSRDKLTNQIGDIFRDEFMSLLEEKFGFTPKSEILIHSVFEKVQLSCQRTMDSYFSSLQSPPVELIEELEFLANEFLTTMLQADPTNYTFKCFPSFHSRKFPPSCLQNIAFRKWFVLAALYSRLIVSPDLEHLLSTERLARQLEVLGEPEIVEAMEWARNSTKADQNRVQTYHQALDCISDSLRDLDFSQIAYLIFSLVVFVAGRERDIHELTRAVREQDIAALTEISISRRKAVFDIVRHMKDGQHGILNYQIVLLFDTLIERRRISHNKHVAIKVLKKPVSTFFVAEYTSIFAAFQQMYPKDISDLIVSPRTPSQLEAEQQSKFVTKFISDLVFYPREVDATRNAMHPLIPRSGRLGGPSALPTVDEESTIAQASEATLLEGYPQYQGLQTGFASKGLFQTQQSLNESTSFPRLNESSDLKLLGKLQYLKDSIARLDIQHVQSPLRYTSSRSRSPILCLSGFLCEDADIARDWGIVAEHFPFSEVVSLNWESTKAHKSISQYWTAVKSVNFKTLNQIVIESLNEAIPRFKMQLNPQPQAFKVPQPLAGAIEDTGEVPGEQRSVPKISLPKLGGLNQLPLPSDGSNLRELPQGYSLPDPPEEDIPQETPRGTDTGRLVPTISPEMREQFRYSDLRSWKRKTDPDPFSNMNEDNALDDGLSEANPAQEISELDLLLTKQVLLKSALQLTGKGGLAPSGPGNLNIGALNPEVFEEAKKHLSTLALTAGAYDFHGANPVSKSCHQASLVGQLLALMVGKANLFNKNTPSLCSFSLGSVVAHSLCCTLHDLGCVNSVGDLLLMGSPVDESNFAQNIHKLIGSSGVVQGKISVLYSDRDAMLNYVIRSARVGNTPIGLKPLSIASLCEHLSQKDPDLVLQLEKTGTTLQEYVLSRVDVHNLTETIGEHLDYMQNLKKLLERVEFSGDLRYFKYHSR